MEHKIKITRAQNKPKQIKITLKQTKVSAVDNDRPLYTDSDGRVFYEMRPITYEA